MKYILGLSKGPWCRVSPHSFLCLQIIIILILSSISQSIAQLQMATFVVSKGVCVGVYGVTHSLYHP